MTDKLENLKVWAESELTKYSREMEEAERLHLWALREKYWSYCRIYRRVLAKIGGNGNGTQDGKKVLG